MVTTLLIISSFFVANKCFKWKMSKQNIITISLFLMCIPLIQIQLIIRNENSHYIQANSNMYSEYLNLEVKDGYIGEKKEDRYIIYQPNGDLEILFENLKIEECNKGDSNFEKVVIESEPKLEFNYTINKLLLKDFFIYDLFVENIMDGQVGVTEFYVLNLGEEIKIKGE